MSPRADCAATIIAAADVFTHGDVPWFMSTKRVTATYDAGKRLDSGGLHLGGCPLRSRLQLSCLLDGGVLCSGLLGPGQQVRLDPHEIGDPRRA
jgi:hypothetical protein